MATVFLNPPDSGLGGPSLRGRDDFSVADCTLHWLQDLGDCPLRAVVTSLREKERMVRLSDPQNGPVSPSS